MIDLTGKKGLVLGIANQKSIAYGCARSFVQNGADLAITYRNERSRPYVEPLAKDLGASIFLPCDVQEQGQMETLFEQIQSQWGRLDFALHSIAFASKKDLHGRVTDCSSEGFKLAMDVSCHSFIRMAHYSEPLMQNGGCLLTLTFDGSSRVVREYSLMGPVKAALESSVRYLAAELGEKGIRVQAMSPGPIKTRAASGLKSFDQLLAEGRQRSPKKELVGVEDVGQLASFLVSDAARKLTGNLIYVDSGLHIMG